METPRARTGRPPGCLAAEKAAGRLEKGRSRESKYVRRWGVGRLRTTDEIRTKVGSHRRRAMEGRQPAKENIGQATAPRTGELSDLLRCA
jgi:hypothetical protein